MLAALVALLLFFTGATLGVLGLAGAWEARRRLSWPVAKGSIVQGEVLEVGRHFTGVIRYVYSLQPTTAYRGGDRLEGRLESVTTTSLHEANELLRQYPVGEPVDVRYDPSRPTRSILGPIGRPPGSGRWLAITGVALMVASAALVVLR